MTLLQRLKAMLSRRERRRHAARAAAQAMDSAWCYLWESYWSHASTKDRGDLLPHHWEALKILARGQREALTCDALAWHFPKGAAA